VIPLFHREKQQKSSVQAIRTMKTASKCLIPRESARIPLRRLSAEFFPLISGHAAELQRNLRELGGVQEL